MVIVFLNLKLFITMFSFIVFEKDLNRITCSLCLLLTSAFSILPSLPHSPCILFSPCLCLNLHASPSSLPQECGRTCYSDACMTGWWRGLHSCCCLWWLFPAESLLSVFQAAEPGLPCVTEAKNRISCVLTRELELEQTFDVVLRLFEMFQSKLQCLRTCLYL